MGNVFTRKQKTDNAGAKHCAGPQDALSCSRDWLRATYRRLEQRSPAEGCSVQLDLYTRLRSEAAVQYQTPVPPAGAECSIDACHVVTTNRDQMIQVAPYARTSTLAEADKKILEDVHVRLRTGFEPFVSVEADLGFTPPPGLVSYSQQLNAYLSIPQNQRSPVYIWDAKGEGISEQRAADVMAEVLNPGFLQTNQDCVAFGTCYDNDQGMLRVLKWVGDYPCRTLHCQYVLHGVPLWLMTAWEGENVSSSLILRRKRKDNTSQPFLVVYSNDADTWDGVRTAIVKTKQKVATPGCTLYRPPGWTFPGAVGSWKDTIFTAGSDLGWTDIGQAGEYLCASIPVLMGLAITKISDFREVNLSTYTHKLGGHPVAIWSSDARHKNVTACGHVELNAYSRVQPARVVASVVAFNQGTQENYMKYLWD